MFSRSSSTKRRRFPRPILGLVVLVVGLGCISVFRSHYHHPKTTTALTPVQVSPLARATPMPQASSSAAPHCDTGYILIPANPLYHTTDFCVMKYEAKCAYIKDPQVGIQPTKGDPAFGASEANPEGVYKNSGKASACVTANGRAVVSTASGSPITFITGKDATSDNASAYCENILAHLISNDEWMTIARNVEQVAADWCSRDGTGCGNQPGTPGKILANGYNDFHNEPAASGGGVGALIAASDDRPCFGTTTDGSNTCGGKHSQKRTLTLSNGQVIWDLAGNVWEWTSTTTARKDEPSSSTKGVLDTGWTTSDFSPGFSSSVLTDNGKGPTLGYDAFRPSNPTWNATQGVGRIYHYGAVNDTDTTAYDFLRGGNWRHGSDDGAFTIHLSPPLDKAGIDDVGFRCVKPVLQ